MDAEIKSLLSFMVSSAMELSNEESPYGSLRMMQTFGKMALWVTDQGLCQDRIIKDLGQRVTDGSNMALTDRPAFNDMIEDVALALIDIS